MAETDNNPCLACTAGQDMPARLLLLADQVAHLNARDTTLALRSIDPNTCD